MTHTYSISGMTCSGCAASVEKALRQTEGAESVIIDLEQSTAQIRMQHHIPLENLRSSLAILPSYQISENGGRSHSPALMESGPVITVPSAFWNDKLVWRRASFNTVNCLIGCSIGDFGMIIFLQKFYPHTLMSVQMVLAVIAGLATSVLLETALLRTREKFAWRVALQTALSMSFLSMVSMEVVMNLTDFMLTGGKAAFSNPFYWSALGVSMVAGFLTPLPYNYFKLKKYNQACH